MLRQVYRQLEGVAIAEFGDHIEGEKAIMCTFYDLCPNLVTYNTIEEIRIGIEDKLMSTNPKFRQMEMKAIEKEDSNDGE